MAYTGPSVAIAELVTRPERSVIRQSFDARERLGRAVVSFEKCCEDRRGLSGISMQPPPNVYEIGALNADGFGLGWYNSSGEAASVQPCVFKDTGPAWNNRNLVNIAKRIASPLIFAHVRAAGPGMGICSCSCHPFEFGRYLFMHNGQISGFGKIRRRLMESLRNAAFDFAIQNSCSDSAVAFAVLIDQLDDALEAIAPAQLQAVVRTTIRRLCDACDAEGVEGASLLNFVVSDGNTLVATRYVHVAASASPEEKANARAATLYFASGTRFEAEEGPGTAEGVKRYHVLREDVRDEVVIVTSEPLTEKRADWISIPSNHILLVTPSKNILLSPVAHAKDTCADERASQSIEYKDVLERLQLNFKHAMGSPLPLKEQSIRNVDCNIVSPQPGNFFNGESFKSAQIASDSAYPMHTMTEMHATAVLAIAIFDKYLFSADGGGSGNLCVWDLSVWKCIQSIELSRGGVLAMCIDESSSMLFVSSSNNVVQTWRIEQVEERISLALTAAIVFPNVGHIISLAFDSKHRRLFSGSQDSCLRAVKVGANLIESQETCEIALEDNAATCSLKIAEYNLVRQGKGNSADALHATSHFAYVHKIMVQSQFVISAAGDGLIKLWDRETLKLVDNLVGHHGVVLSLTFDQSSKTLFSGSLDATVCVWDLKSKACRRVLLCPSPVLCVKTVDLATKSVLISSHADQSITIWSLRSLQVVDSFENHDGLVLCMGSTATSSSSGAVPPMSNRLRSLLVCGTSTGSIVSWTLKPNKQNLARSRSSSSWNTVTGTMEQRFLQIEQRLTELLDDEDDDAIVDILGELVSIRTVSADATYHEECFFGAKVISRFLEKIGCASVKMHFNEVDQHAGQDAVPILPVVLGTLKANDLSEANPKNMVVYGHYDVVEALSSSWTTDPWQLVGKDGYLYGRGVTDDKGPLLAAIMAGKTLHAVGKLRCNLTFLIEGQEESGLGLAQRGFPKVLAANPEFFSRTDGILISNNYWIDDDRPCLTYSMRGVIDLKVEITGPGKDLHAGVHGGCLFETLDDLLVLLVGLKDDNGRISIPELNENVRKLSKDESEAFAEIALDLQGYSNEIGGAGLRLNDSVEVLRSRWCEPSISLSSVSTSNKAEYFRRVPKCSSAKVSIHFVPDQDSKEIVVAVEDFLRKKFDERKSKNEIAITVQQISEWWLGDISNNLYTIAEEAIESVWAVKPLLVREGGSYGGISAFLEQKLAAPVIHLPLGQATDSAHLPNERISVENLLKGKVVIEEFLRRFF